MKKGVFELNDNVSKYIPQFNDLVVYDSTEHAKAKDPIKIIDLLDTLQELGTGGVIINI